MPKEDYKGILVYHCEKHEKDLYQIYIYLTGNNPVAQKFYYVKKKL